METGTLMNPSLYGSVEETTIFLKAMKTIPVKVKTTDTVKNIKARFQEIEVTSEEPQDLILAGKCMEDGRMLMEYHIRKNSTVEVMLQKPIPMQVFIRIPSKEKHIMLELRSTDTIHNVKVKIHGVEGVPPDRQTLVFTGRTLEDSQKTLSDYRVRNQATLVVVFRPRDKGMRLGIRTEVGETVVVDVKSWYTIRDIKAIAKSMLGMSQDEGRQIYDGKRLLQDDDLTVMDCMLKKGSILQYH